MMSPHYQKTLQPKHISRISKNLTKSKRSVVRYSSTNPEILKDPENKFGEKFKVSFVWWRQEPKEEKRSARKIKSSEERKTKKSQFGFNQTVFKSSNLAKWRVLEISRPSLENFPEKCATQNLILFSPTPKKSSKTVGKGLFENNNMLTLENSFDYCSFIE